MHDISQVTRTEINRLHELATKTASDAIEYAKQAGVLLLKVKDELPYGVFGKWLDQNLSVSARQAQRYMAAAQGKAIPIEELADEYDALPQLTRNDTVSHLSNYLSQQEIDSLVDGTWTPNWKPEAGCWYITATELGAYWVVPDLKRPDLFHVSRFYSDGPEDDGGLFDRTRWAELADLVEIRLKGFQLAEPGKANWKIYKKAGLSGPFGAPKRHGTLKIIAKDGFAGRSAPWQRSARPRSGKAREGLAVSG